MLQPLVAAAVLAAALQDPAEPLLVDAPDSIRVTRTVVVDGAQLVGLGATLGSRLERVTNSFIEVHGAAVQLNVVVAVDERGADRVFERLERVKQHPFLVRFDERTIVEYVGPDAARAVAEKASWELGFEERPEAFTYQVRAYVAAVAEASYMDCNPLFNAFLALGADPTEERESDVRELAARFTFGDSIALRSAGVSAEASPEPIAGGSDGVTTEMRFADLPTRLGVPTVFLDMRVDVDGTGFTRAPAPGPDLVASTSFWPVGDEHVTKLAARVVGDADGAPAKVSELLEFLTPGRTLRYGGPAGSRHGTLTALRQRVGRCWDFSDAFVTLARASGVPARQVAGWFYGVGGHVWAEYYDAERGGWQQVDPTGGGLLDAGPYHVPWFTTEDGDMPIVYLVMPEIAAQEAAPR